jgi:hypothetical protein
MDGWRLDRGREARKKAKTTLTGGHHAVGLIPNMDTAWEEIAYFQNSELR